LSKEEHLFELETITTTDPLEVVAHLIHIKTPNDDSIWDMTVHTKYGSTHNAIYWMTGGDLYWRQNDFYKVKWCVGIDTLDDYFGPGIKEHLQEKMTLGKIRDILLWKLNPWKVYSLCITKDLL
jgi:hypothetical protein